ncbi:MAG TPA: AAA family ATPase, partial [Gemmatimonadales bacterium]|nr:AAA family ATPase [Gemmatimonadales bacterium]
MAETFYLKLMGIPELRRPDGRPLKLKVRKHLALLVYLVMDERPVHLRDELAELLWPGVPEENSRHSLSMAFTVLRGIFGAECLTGNHAEIRFRPPRLVRDLDRLEAGELLAEAGQPSLEVDGFLRGFHIDDAPQFQHWRDRRHAQLLPLIQAALLTLVDQARRSADLPGMLALADRLLVLDPLAEEAVRARMEALALQGDRVSALRAYEAWREELERELGARPSEPLRGMAERLRRGMETRPSRFASSGGEGRLAAPRLVGRAAEYGVLWEAWERTTQYNTRHVLLGGETGVGKSTLAMRFAAAAELEGAAVARVQCFELEQRMAFGMIGALITSLLERPGALATAPEALAEVARMVPRVRERLRGLPAPRPAEGEAARLHFAEGTLALLDSILEEQPVLLIVDDYPRSDEASLSVLHLVLRRAVQQRLMVVLLGRPPESDESPQAARLRQAGTYLPLDRIELGVLPEPDSDELLSGLLLGASRQPASPERRALLRTAGGNPMALELLTQDWLTHGDAALAVLLPAMGDDVPASALEAAGYDRLIERMLPAMTPRTRMALYLAAILGPRLNELECFEVLEFSPVQTIAALSELVQQRLLRDTGRGLEFVNELIRARLYLKIPTAARVRLHYGVAERLLAAVAAGTAVPGLEIAWHCIRARRREEATPFLLTGARDAITHGAPDEAARALSSAVGQLKGSAKAEATLL